MVSQALLQQVTEYIAQYTPKPRIISYLPNANGDVMGRFESQGRVFSFRLSNKGLVYKPVVPRKDGESDEQYALRFDTGSEILLDRLDAAKAYKPKPSISIANAKKQRGTRENPKCGVTSYQCGVCISLGKNCIKNANTEALKERLSKINSLARMAAKGETVPQVKTGVIGDKNDPKSLMKKAQAQARELAKDGKTSTNPKPKPAYTLTRAEYEKKVEKGDPFAFQNTMEIDYGRLPRGQGKRVGGMVMGAMGSGLLQGKKQYSHIVGNLPDQERSEIAPLEKIAQIAYAKARSVGFSHDEAALSAYAVNDGKSPHEWHVERALRTGEKVPPEVLKDYPDLAKQYGKQNQPSSKIPDLTNNAVHKGQHTQIKRTGDLYEVRPSNMLASERFVGDKETAEKVFKDAESGSARDAAEKIKGATYKAPVSDSPTRKALVEQGAKSRVLDAVDRLLDPKLLTADKDTQKAARSELYGHYRSQRDAGNGAYAARLNAVINEFDGKVLKGSLKPNQSNQSNYAVGLASIGNGFPNNPKAIEKWAAKHNISLDEIIANHGAGLTPQAAKKNSPEFLALLDAFYNDKPFNYSGKKTPNKGIGETLSKFVTPEGEKDDYIPLTNDKNLSNYRKKQQRSTDQIAIDRAKSDVGNATKRINAIDTKIKATTDPKKIAQLERQKADWVEQRDRHQERFNKLSTPTIQGVGNTEAERRQFLLNTNAEQSNKVPEPKREIELADVKTPQERVKYATQELNIAKASKDPERINKWIEELQRAKKALMSQAQVSANTYQPDLFFVNKGNPNQRSLFDRADAEYDDSVERNILSNIGLMISRAMSGNQASPNTIQLRKVKYVDGNVSGIFTQYGSQYNFEISSKGIVINPLQVRQDRIAGIPYKKTAKIGANRKCGRGYKCKGTCISKNNKCRVNWASKEGLEQYKSMLKELNGLTSPRFIEINGRQVAQTRTPAEDAKTLALAKRLSEAREARREFSKEYKAKTAKTYKIITDRVNAEVERRLKDANLSPSKVKSTLAELDPKDIAVDPKRFQYKITGEHTATGTVGSLQGVGKWDENLAGILQVWKDPKDGKTYVVNGHNRLAKANELGADKVAVRYLEVPTHQEARTIGAMTNIAEGRGNALDAAKFFRDTNWTKEDLVKKGIPLKEKIATDGLAIAALEPNLFRQVIDGELPLERAAIIGGSGLDHAKQKSLVELLDKRKNINNAVLSELIDTVKYSGQKQEEQFDLFGNSTATVDLAVQRASLQSFVKQKLASEKKLFGTVSKSKSAKDLERGGNQIDIDQSSKIADEAGTALKIFDTIKHHVGGVSDALNQASERLANAKNKSEQDKIKRETYEQVLKAVQLENDKLLKGAKRSDSRQRTDSNNFGQSAADQDQILTYITDPSGNMMGIVQLQGIKYRFLKPIFGSTVLTPISETGLSYLFDMAPDLSLPMCETLKGLTFNADSKVKKKERSSKFVAELHPRYPKGHPNAGEFMPKANWQEASGKTVLKQFQQWEQGIEKLHDYLYEVEERKDKILDYELSIAANKRVIKQNVNAARKAIREHESKIDHNKAVKEKKKRLLVNGEIDQKDYDSHIAYRDNAIAYHKQEIQKERDNLKKSALMEIQNKNYLNKLTKAKKELKDFEKVPEARIQDAVELYEGFNEFDISRKGLIGVKDGKKLGAVAEITAKKDHVYIDFLMTNPELLLENKNRGAGTALVKSIVQKSIKLGKNGAIETDSLDSSVEFFKKLGFTKGSANTMRLSPDAAKKLIGE